MKYRNHFYYASKKFITQLILLSYKKNIRVRNLLQTITTIILTFFRIALKITYSII